MVLRDDSGLESGAMFEGGVDTRGDCGFEDCGVNIDHYDDVIAPPSRDATIDPYLADTLNSVSDAILDKLSESTVSREDLIRILNFYDAGSLDVDLGLVYPISGEVPEGVCLTYAIDVDGIDSLDEDDFEDVDDESLLDYVEESLDTFKGLALEELSADQKYLLYEYFEHGGEIVVNPNREVHGRDLAIVFYVDFSAAPPTVED